MGSIYFPDFIFLKLLIRKKNSLSTSRQKKKKDIEI
jgi:hypothetical protein